MLHAELHLHPPAKDSPIKNDKKFSSFFQIPESIKQYFDKNGKMTAENGTNYSLEIRDKKKEMKRVFLIIFGLAVALIIIASIIVAAIIQGNSNPTSNMSNSTASLVLVNRMEWNAKPQNGKIPILTPPAHFVIISETNTANCSSKTSCSSLVKEIQDIDMNSKSLFDISYNFLVGSDLNIYEGRGWNLQGEAAEEYKDKSIQIALIGTFDSANQNKAQLHKCSLLVSKGIELGYIDINFKFFIQKHLQTTILLEEVPSWDDWIRQFFPTIF